MGQVEILVALLLHARIIFRIVLVAGGLEGGVKVDRVRKILFALIVEQGRQVTAASEPAVGGDQHARIHVNGRHARIVHVRDKRDAGGPELAARLVGAGDLRAESLGEVAIDAGDMHADLLEELALHDRHGAAAKVFRPVAARPGRFHESAGFAVIERRLGFVFQRLEPGDDVALK